MDNAEIIEAIKKISEYCKKITCSECDFCDKVTGECAFALAFTWPESWGKISTFVPPSEWRIGELRRNE